MRENQTNIEENKSLGKKHKVFCINCSTQTNHVTLSSINRVGDVNGWFTFTDDYEIIKCLGCDKISFRHEHANSEDHRPEYNIYTGLYEPDMDIKIYPKRSQDTRKIKSFHRMHLRLKKIYEETINCYNNDNLILCGAGIRATVESLCIENGVKNGPVTQKNSKIKRKRNLEGKINGLVEKKILINKQAKTLHELRFLGNTAIHEIKSISKKELNIAINILEMIFNNLYEIPHKGNILKNKRIKK